jgi:hypothetical protein
MGNAIKFSLIQPLEYAGTLSFAQHGIMPKTEFFPSNPTFVHFFQPLVHLYNKGKVDIENPHLPLLLDSEEFL